LLIDLTELTSSWYTPVKSAPVLPEIPGIISATPITMPLTYKKI
jgi:hypothetical protein